MARTPAKTPTPLLDSFSTVMGNRKRDPLPDRASSMDAYDGRFGAIQHREQRVYRPTHNQKFFLADKLKMRGLPHDHLDQVKFVEGLDSDANGFSRSALDDGAEAVTRGDTVYVQPLKFDEVTNFSTDTPFEEVYHTAQFRSDGGPDFYNRYGQQSAGGFLQGLGTYDGNVYENFAKGAAKEMRNSYHSKKRTRWR